MPLSELLSKPTAGRQPDATDTALDGIVAQVNENPDKAIGWAYAPLKKATAVQKARRSIERSGMVNKVFANTKGDQIFFTTQPLRKPRK